jgi:hypothetical protein
MQMDGFVPAYNHMVPALAMVAARLPAHAPERARELRMAIFIQLDEKSSNLLLAMPLWWHEAAVAPGGAAALPGLSEVDRGNHGHIPGKHAASSRRPRRAAA